MPVSPPGSAPPRSIRACAAFLPAVFLLLRVMTARDTVGDSSRVLSIILLNSADMMTRPSLSLAQQPRRLDRAPALAKCHLGLAGARRVFSTSWQRASPA